MKQADGPTSRMGDSELLCNFRSCRRSLCDVAWVTFCSHIFCDVHGKPLSQVPVECPACGAKLAVEIDVHRVILNPSEQFKSMVLAGLKPNVVMEVCNRALTFWNYQKEQEQGYQRHVISKLRERLQQVEAYYEQVVRSRDARFTTVQRQLHDMQREHKRFLEERRATNELLTEKTRQYQKLQVLYDSLRKRTGHIRSRSLSPSGSHEAGAIGDGSAQPQGPLALMADDHHHQVPPRASTSPRTSHHHQQNVQLLNEPTQQQPNDRSTRLPSTAPYHLPLHFSHLTSLNPGNPYQQRRDRDTYAAQGIPRAQVGRYQNAPQEYHKGGTSQNHSSGSVRPREIRSFTLRTPRRYSSEDFTFRPAIFGDRDPGGENQGGSGDPSRNEHRPPV